MKIIASFILGVSISAMFFDKLVTFCPDNKHRDSDKGNIYYIKLTEQIR